MYLRDSIRFTLLKEVMDRNFEVLWVQVRPYRLPRGVQSIVVGTVYHPPAAQDSLMINYLYESISAIEVKYPDCGIIIAGDFNKLNIARIKNGFGLKQIVQFPTRGQSVLDLVLTNSASLYDAPKKIPPFGLSDHYCVMVHPNRRQDLPSQKVSLKSRDLKLTNCLAMQKYIEEVDIKVLVNGKD